MPSSSVGLCNTFVLLISVNWKLDGFRSIRDPSKLAKTRSILNRCHDYTLQTKGQVPLIH